MDSRTVSKKNIGNLASLACIQLSNAMLPIIAFPLILNVVGATLFSKIVFTEALALLAVAFVLYSFEIEGVSKIAGLNVEENITKISHAFSGILYVRLIIWLFCAFALLVSSFFIDKDLFALLSGWILLPLSYVLNSYWFYQGVEKNLFPAIMTLLTRFLCLGILIKFIIVPKDYHLVPIIIGVTYVVGGLVSLLYIRFNFKVKFVRISYFEMRRLIFVGKEIFFGNISVTLFRDSNVIILGLLSSSMAVSVYSIAEKSIKIFQAGARPLNQLFFPKVIRAISGMNHPTKSAFSTILKYTAPQLAALAIAASLIFIIFVSFRSDISYAFNFHYESDIIKLISIMVIAVFFGVSNYMFGMVGLNYLCSRGYLAKAIFITGICSILCCIFLVLIFAEFGAAISFIFSEIFLFILISKIYFRHDSQKL